MVAISVIAELELLGDKFIPAGPNEIKVLCPFHGDTEPSCCVNTEKLVFNCKACQAHGDFVHWLAKRMNVPRNAVLVDLGKRYQLEETVKVVEPSVVEGFHERIWTSGPLLQALRDRGVTDQMIRLRRLGVMPEGRISIPIPNAGGHYVNIRRYLPGAPGPQKMKNQHGRGKMRIYPQDQLKYDTIMVCGGEIKAIVAADQLNPHGVGAVCACGGEGNWGRDLDVELAGKGIYVMMDVDEAGERAVRKIASRLKRIASWVKTSRLPLDKDKYPKGDINDFIAREKGDLWTVLSDEALTALWQPAAVERQMDEDPEAVKFGDTLEAENVGRRVEFSAVVTAKVDRPFFIPKKIRVHCDKSETCCPLCNVYPQDKTDFEVPAESAAVLEMVSVPAEQLDLAIRHALHVPRKCKSVTFETAEHWRVEDARASPSLEIGNCDEGAAMQQVVCVSCECELNTTYEFTGRTYPHPKTQAAALVVSQSKTTNDALSRFVPTRLEELRLFQPWTWTVEGLKEKLDDIYDDFAKNVTRIFLRPDNHLFVDFSYHSPLLLDVDGQSTKGWTDVMIMGDSACGKSEVLLRLREHYGLGAFAPCKNASAAGLIGGVRQIGNQWFIAWGVIPMNDRRQVTLEEAKGIETTDIAKMTDTRSSGVAEIDKIERRSTLARTRLLWLSNPRRDRNMATYGFGVEAIKDLVGAPEDVRRLDAALIVNRDEVTSAQHGALVSSTKKGEPKYSGDLCRELILWAWTRTREQVLIEPATAEYIGHAAAEMCKIYSETIPLVDGGTMRAKLTRLAAALACRTFSTTQDGHGVLVRPCHAEFVVQTLERVYSSRTFGYKFFSQAERVQQTMRDPDDIKRELEMLGDCESFKERLLHSDLFDQQDICDWTGLDRPEAQRLLSLLIRKFAIERVGRPYRKSPEFINFLRQVELTPAPAHLRPKEKF